MKRIYSIILLIIVLPITNGCRFLENVNWGEHPLKVNFTAERPEKLISLKPLKKIYKVGDTVDVTHTIPSDFKHFNPIDIQKKIFATF